MNATDTDREAIGHLDWEVCIECASKACDVEAGHLVFVTPGPPSHPHDKWYPACGKHAAHLASGHAKCVACDEQIALVAIRDL